jgi:hypothetical protein
MADHLRRKACFVREQRFKFASLICKWIKKPCGHRVDACEDGSERAVNEMLLSRGEDLVNEFTEFCRGEVRHKRTLKRKDGKRKGEGISYILSLCSLCPVNNSSSISAHPRASAPGTRPVISKPTPTV